MFKTLFKDTTDAILCIYSCRYSTDSKAQGWVSNLIAKNTLEVFSLNISFRSSLHFLYHPSLKMPQNSEKCIFANI